MDDVVARVGIGHLAGDLGKGIHGHVLGVVATAVDAYIPAQLLGGAKIAIQRLQLDAIEGD